MNPGIPSGQDILNTPDYVPNYTPDQMNTMIAAVTGNWDTGGQVLGDSTNTSNYSAPATPTLTQAQIDQYNQAIANTQAAYDRTGTQLNSGYGTIDSSYQNALNQLLLGKNQAQQTYNDNTLASGQNYVGGKNTVRSNAGSALNGLLRLLGSRGAGGGSAANVVAPGAVARTATLQSSDLANTYGQNRRALDTNWGNYMSGYNNQVTGAAAQKDTARQGLESQIATNRASLLQTLADLTNAKNNNTSGQTYLDQANAILNQAANVSAAPINYQTQAYTAPTLASYTTSPNPTPTFNGQAATNDYTSPYLQALLGKKQPAVA